MTMPIIIQARDAGKWATVKQFADRGSLPAAEMAMRQIASAGIYEAVRVLEAETSPQGGKTVWRLRHTSEAATPQVVADNDVPAVPVTAPPPPPPKSKPEESFPRLIVYGLVLAVVASVVFGSPYERLIRGGLLGFFLDQFR